MKQTWLGARHKGSVNGDLIVNPGDRYRWLVAGGTLRPVPHPFMVRAGLALFQSCADINAP